MNFEPTAPAKATMLDRVSAILEWLRLQGQEASPPFAAGPAQAVPSRGGNIDDQIAARLRMDNVGPLVAGSLELVGLADVRRRTGPMWEYVSDNIRTIAEAEIGAMLGDDDFFRCIDEVTFLICFASSSETAADVKAKGISAAIRTRILEAFPFLGSSLSVESITSSVDAAELMQMQGGSLTDNLLAVLRRVREDLRQTLRTQRSSLMRGFRVHFLPAVSPGKQQFVLNHCKVEMPAELLGPSQWRVLAKPQDVDRTLAELDLCLLTRAVEVLHDVVKKGPCAPLLVPVNLSTVVDSVYAREYSALAAEIPEQYRPLVVLELNGITDDGTSLAAARAEILSNLPISRLAVHLDLEQQPSSKLAAAGLWGLSTSLTGRRSIEPTLSNVLRAFNGKARQLGVLTIAHAADSIGLAKLATGAGFHIIDGSAVALPCPAPKAPSPVPPSTLGGAGLPLRKSSNVTD
jgi:hypothetical protein